MKKCLFLCLSLLLVPVLALCEPRAVLFTATDLHYIAPTLTDNGALFTDLIERGDGKAMAYSDALIEAFVAQVIAEKPDALILSGDLTFNGARESHEALSLRLARVRDAGIPVFVLPGNHDLNSSSAARFEGDGYTRVDGVTGSAPPKVWTWSFPGGNVGERLFSSISPPRTWRCERWVASWSTRGDLCCSTTCLSVLR